MSTLAALGFVGLGAYLVTRAQRQQLEAMTEISALANDITPSRDSNNLLVPLPERAPGREDFLAGQDLAFPDGETSTINIPKFYNFPKKEQLSSQMPELTSHESTLPMFSRTYEKDRFGTMDMGTLRDFRNAKGEFIDSNSTGQQAPLRQTVIEAIVNQTPVVKTWDLQPHVIRINDDQAGRPLAISPYWQSTFRPRMEETCRKKFSTETTNIRPSLSNELSTRVVRPNQAPQGLERDRSIVGNHTTITPHWLQNNRPQIRSDPSAEYTSYEDMTRLRPTITPQWDGQSAWYQSQLEKQNKRSDEYASTFTARAGTADNLGWRQMGIESQKRRVEGDVINVRVPEIQHNESEYINYVRPENESRKGGLRLQDVTTWNAAYGNNTMDIVLKPAPRGATGGTFISDFVQEYDPRNNI